MILLTGLEMHKQFGCPRAKMQEKVIFQPAWDAIVHPILAVAVVWSMLQHVSLYCHSIFIPTCIHDCSLKLSNLPVCEQ